MSLSIIKRPGPRPYPPRVSEFTGAFWTALAEGRLMTTRGTNSGRLAFPPRPFCPHDWGREVEWVELSGRGTLYSRYLPRHLPDVIVFDQRVTSRYVERILIDRPVLYGDFFRADWTLPPAK